ncbi:hypothetical protein DY000_02037293 [Brassica cretica]|uniref:Uncharacterized protein n=1 Tax=Brassica cretica TaxID=69181 RepID=A0ABQ7B5B5_BRACR|nr:hypothetical protein DY000_02037293 [Brassica cretica]
MLVKCREAALRRAPLMAIASAMQGEETWFRDRAFCCKTVEDESVKIHAIPAESDFQAASVLQKTVESRSGESCRGSFSLDLRFGLAPMGRTSKLLELRSHMIL